MKNYILHISDLHFVKNAPAYNTLAFLRQKAKDKVKDVPTGNKLLIVTGDFHNYQDQDYKSAESFLRELINDMGLDLSEDVFVVPGNHDVGNPEILKTCGCSDDCDLKQESAVAALKGLFSNKNHRRYMQWRMEAFRPFCQFIQNLGIYKISQGEFHPAETHVRKWRGKLNILHLNTALIADGETKNDQMTDTDTASNPKTWKDCETKNTPSIAIAHNSYFDLKKEQRKELSETFNANNVSAYLCGDRHRTEHDSEQQMIRLQSGFKKGEEIPNLVAPKAIADRNDNYSEIGFSLHEWDEITDKVTVEFWKKDNDRMVKLITDDEPDGYVMRRTEQPVSTPKSLDEAYNFLDEDLASRIKGLYEQYQKENVALRTPQILSFLLQSDVKLLSIFNFFSSKTNPSLSLGDEVLHICRKADARYRQEHNKYNRQYEDQFLEMVGRAESVRLNNGLMEDYVTTNVLCYALLLSQDSATVVRIRKRLDPSDFETLKKWVLEARVPSTSAQ